MTIGPIERLSLRLSELEEQMGLRPGGRAWQRKAERKEEKLGPGGRWLLARLDSRHPEALDRQEQDLLGEAILAQDRGDLQAAQTLLDGLARVHKLRLEAERSNFKG